MKNETSTQTRHSKRRAFLQALNSTGFTILIAVNMLANALPINGKNTGELSGQYPNLFVPAGITFSIWGLIYLLFLVFTYHQSRRTHRTSAEENFLDRIGVLFFISCIANASWLFAWHYENIPASLAIMLVLLGSLLAIYLKLDIGRSKPSREEKLYVHIPFSIYLGWITVATIANVTTLLVSRGWAGMGLGDVFWTILVMVVGALIAIIAIIHRRDIYFALVPSWALFGIYIKRVNVTPTYWSIAYASLALAITVLVAISISVVLEKKNPEDSGAKPLQ